MIVSKTIFSTHVGDNEIKGISKRAFRGLDKLHTLELDGNPIQGLRVDAFADLRSLETLSIMSTKLTTLPSGVFNIGTKIFIVCLD